MRESYLKAGLILAVVASINMVASESGDGQR